MCRTYFHILNTEILKFGKRKIVHAFCLWNTSKMRTYDGTENPENAGQIFKRSRDQCFSYNSRLNKISLD